MSLGMIALESGMLQPVASPPAAFDSFMESFKPVLPIPSFLLVLPLVWLLFRNTWRGLDEDAHRHRAGFLAKGTMDYRPFIALVLCALILTMQEYYGGRGFFDRAIRPLLEKYDLSRGGILKLGRYDELWGFAWWVFTRVSGYVFVPFTVWKLVFPEDSLLDFGLRTKGFFKHTWIYAIALAIVLPSMLVVARAPDFGTYYPFYKTASRSWFDFLAWEAMYFAQFFALEMFFRGFWLGALRKSFGSGAIFAMAVPYCMIHYGKPYLEANGAIIAGIFLGSLSMLTRSIYQGFLLHITVAGLMDWLALARRDALPHAMWPPENFPPDVPDAMSAADGWLHFASDALVVAIVVAIALVGIGLRVRMYREKMMAIDRM